MNDPVPFRWLRIAAIAIGAIILASCRSLTVPAVLSAMRGFFSSLKCTSAWSMPW